MLHPLAASCTTLTAAAAIDIKDLQMSEDEKQSLEGSAARLREAVERLEV